MEECYLVKPGLDKSKYITIKFMIVLIVVEYFIVLGDSASPIDAVYIARVIVLFFVVLMGAGFNLNFNESAIVLHGNIVGSTIWYLMGWVSLKV